MRAPYIDIFLSRCLALMSVCSFFILLSIEGTENENNQIELNFNKINQETSDHNSYIKFNNFLTTINKTENYNKNNIDIIIRKKRKHKTRRLG